MTSPFEQELQRRGLSSTGPAEKTSPFEAELARREARGGAVDTAAQYPMGFNAALAKYADPVERVARMGVGVLHGKTPDWDRSGAPISDWLRDSPEPVNATQRVVRRAGEVTGETVPYAATFLRGAPAVANAARIAGPNANAVTQGVGTAARGIANSPAVASVGELAAASSAGASSGVSREMLPGNEMADTLATFGGGFAPGALMHTPTAYAIRGGSKLMERFSPASQRTEARNQVAKTLGGELTPEAMQGIGEGQRLRREIPGYEPSLAESTGSQSLIATQRNLEAGASGSKLDQITKRREGNQRAIEAYARGSAPAGLNNPEMVIDTATQRVERLRGGIERQRANLGEVSAANVNNLPTANRAEAGAGLRSSIGDRQNDARVRMARLSDVLGISDADISVPFARFQDELRGGLSRTAFEDRANVPGVVTEILNFGRRTPDSMRSLLQQVRRGGGQRPRSLMQFLRSKGGIKDDAGELRARDFGGRGGLLNNKTGRRLDDLAQSATEAGYFPGLQRRATPDELLEALDQEARGRPVYSEFDYSASQRADDIDTFRGELDRAGVNLNLPDEEIVRRMEFDTGTRSGPSVTFKDLMGLRSRISDDLRDSMASANPSAKKIRALTELERRVDDFVSEATNSADPELAGRYREFRQAYKQEYVDRFRQGAAFKVRARDGRGFYKVPDERVAEAFFSDVNGIRQFRRTFGEDAPEFEALEAVALDDLRLAAVRNGEFNPTLFNTWLRRNESKLAELPGLHSRVRSFQEANDAVLGRNAELTRRERVIGQQLLTRQLAALERGKEPRAVIDAAIKSPRLMTQLVRSVRGQPEAMAALQRSVWNEADMGSADNLENYLTANRASLQQVLEPGHWIALNNIAAALKQAARVPAPAGRAIDTNPLAGVEGAIGTGINQLASRLFAAETGRTSWRMVGMDLLGRFSRAHSRAEAARLMDEALYNPDIAKDLAAMFLAKRVPPASAGRLNSWLFTLGQEKDEGPRVPR